MAIPLSKLEETRRTSTMLPNSENIAEITTPPRTSTPVAADGNDTLGYIVQTLQSLSDQMNALKEVTNKFAEKRNILNQTFTNGSSNTKRISDIKPSPSSDRNTRNNKFINMSNAPAYFSKPKLPTTLKCATPLNPDRHKFVTSNPLTIKKKLNTIPTLTKPKDSPLPKSNHPKVTVSVRCSSASITTKIGKSSTITKTITKK